jgi:hypothetical protein
MDGFAKIISVDPTFDQVPSLRQLADYDNLVDH